MDLQLNYMSSPSSLSTKSSLWSILQTIVLSLCIIGIGYYIIIFLRESNQSASIVTSQGNKYKLLYEKLLQETRIERYEKHCCNDCSGGVCRSYSPPAPLEDVTADALFSLDTINNINNSNNGNTDNGDNQNQNECYHCNDDDQNQNELDRLVFECSNK